MECMKENRIVGSTVKLLQGKRVPIFFTLGASGEMVEEGTSEWPDKGVERSTESETTLKREPRNRAPISRKEYSRYKRVKDFAVSASGSERVFTQAQLNTGVQRIGGIACQRRSVSDGVGLTCPELELERR
jgi:hypothetical protein